MITNRRMGLKIWRIQRIKIPGITESKRKPLDYKTRQRVGMIPKSPPSLENAGLLRCKSALQRQNDNILVCSVGNSIPGQLPRYYYF